MEYFYIITTPDLRVNNKYKIGITSKEQKELIKQYSRQQPELYIVLYLHVNNSKDLENKVKSILYQHRIDNYNGNKSEYIKLDIREIISTLLNCDPEISDKPKAETSSAANIDVRTSSFSDLVSKLSRSIAELNILDDEQTDENKSIFPNWVTEGSYKLYTNGLPLNSKGMLLESAQIKRCDNFLVKWIYDRCILKEGVSQKFGDLYTNYSSYYEYIWYETDTNGNKHLKAGAPKMLTSKMFSMEIRKLPLPDNPDIDEKDVKIINIGHKKDGGTIRLLNIVLKS